jgi:hypothetical protein
MRLRVMNEVRRTADSPAERDESGAKLARNQASPEQGRIGWVETE